MIKSKIVMVLGVDGFDPKILEPMLGAAHKARPQERIQWPSTWPENDVKRD